MEENKKRTRKTKEYTWIDAWKEFDYILEHSNRLLGGKKVDDGLRLPEDILEQLKKDYYKAKLDGYKGTWNDYKIALILKGGNYKITDPIKNEERVDIYKRNNNQNYDKYKKIAGIIVTDEENEEVE